MTPCALEYHHRSGSENPSVNDGFEGTRWLIRIIRRIEQHEIEALLRPPETRYDTSNIAGLHDSHLVELEIEQIFAQRRHGSRRSLHEDSRGCPARDCLDPQRATSRVQIEHRRPFQVGETTEQGLANPVGGRSDPIAGDAKPPPTELTAGHAKPTFSARHFATTPRSSGDPCATRIELGENLLEYWGKYQVATSTRCDDPSTPLQPSRIVRAADGVKRTDGVVRDALRNIGIHLIGVPQTCDAHPLAEMGARIYTALPRG
jgi:hypothetical protein